MSKTEALERVERLAREAAESCGVEVVAVVFRGQGRRALLRVDIDREGPEGVGLADCEQVSRRLDALLEASGAFGDAPYELQVSSPGLDRPIRSVDDARRNRGRPVVLTIEAPGCPHESLRGILVGLDGDEFVVESEGSGTRRIPAVQVVSAVPDVGTTGPRQRPGRGGKSRKPRDIV